MPKVGDRVIIDGTKLGAPRREGTFLEQIGSLIKVRWADGVESLFSPGAGSVRFEATAKAAKAPTKKAAVKKAPAKAKKKA